MAFTYVGDLSTDLDKVRFYIQDTVENSGPKPSGGNFTDEELTGLIGLVDWEHAVADAFETLASAWAYFVNIQAGPIREDLSDVADMYMKKASKWRMDHNIYVGVSVAGQIRVDGYSDDIASDQVDTSSEYTKTRVYWETPL